VVSPDRRAPPRVGQLSAPPPRQAPAGFAAYLASRQAFFDTLAPHADRWVRRNAHYHRLLRRLAAHYVPPGASVLELGCGTGDLLAALAPARGVGIDLSAQMVAQARAKHPRLAFHHMPAEELDLGGERVDYVVLSDLVGHLYDIRRVLERLRVVCHPGTRIVISWHSRLWQPPLRLAERMGLKPRLPQQNWTTPEDVINLLDLAGFEAMHRRSHILAPKRIPWLARWLNQYLVHLPGFRWLGLTNWIVARPLGLAPSPAPPYTVSVVCPCRNEAGNIEPLVRRLPTMGAHTELIFIEGHSRDATLAECQRVAAAYPERDIKVLVQEGIGKADATRLGLAKATGDIVMVLDADLSVSPEDLPQLYDTLAAGKAEFVNGSRLVYPMAAHAMGFLNLLGNRVFALLLGGILGQPLKDTLCGTKALFRRDADRIASLPAGFGDADPFGDFALLFGAAKLNLRIVEIPLRYQARTYGQTNISRFADGWLLLKLTAAAARRLLFLR
jgi:SAM-dependent methyltransferase